MAFKEGESGNPDGRPKGSANKITGQLREMVSDFLFENFDKIKEDFANLTPRERAKLYCDLLQYGLPKLQTIKMDFETKPIESPLIINWRDDDPSLKKEGEEIQS